ncbi:MAG: YncE family protein, partial [Chloroflexi bacterium]
MSVIALVAAVTVPQVAFAGSVAVTYAVGHLPFGVVVDPADGHVYVSNNGGTTISVVDPAAGTVRSVDVGMQPGPMALDSVGRRLYVSNFGDMTVTVLNLTTLTQVTTSYDGGGLGVAVDPAANMFFAARGTEFVSIDTRTFGVRDFVSPSAAQGWFGVAVDPGLHRVYVTNIATAAPTLEV